MVPIVASLKPSQTLEQAELAKWEAMKPVEEMNREEALDAGYVSKLLIY